MAAKPSSELESDLRLQKKLSMSEVPSHACCAKLKSLIAKYMTLFNNKLGTITDERKELHVKPNCRLIF